MIHGPLPYRSVCAPPKRLSLPGLVGTSFALSPPVKKAIELVYLVLIATQKHRDRASSSPAYSERQATS